MTTAKHHIIHSLTTLLSNLHIHKLYWQQLGATSQHTLCYYEWRNRQYSSASYSDSRLQCLLVIAAQPIAPKLINLNAICRIIFVRCLRHIYTQCICSIVSKKGLGGCTSGQRALYTVFQKNGHPFCFCYNFVSRDQILVIFGCLLAKEICSCPLLTYLKEIAGALC